MRVSFSAKKPLPKLTPPPGERPDDSSSKTVSVLEKSAAKKPVKFRTRVMAGVLGGLLGTGAAATVKQLLPSDSVQGNNIAVSDILRNDIGHNTNLQADYFTSQGITKDGATVMVTAAITWPVGNTEESRQQALMLGVQVGEAVIETLKSITYVELQANPSLIETVLETDTIDPEKFNAEVARAARESGGVMPGLAGITSISRVGQHLNPDAFTTDSFVRRMERNGVQLHIGQMKLRLIQPPQAQ